MRIALVSWRYWPARGGAETALRELARALAERHDVRVLAWTVDEGPTTRLSDSLRPPPAFIPFHDGHVRVEQVALGRARRVALLPMLAQVTPGARRFAYGSMRRVLSRYYSALGASPLAEQLKGSEVVHVHGTDLPAACAVAAAHAASVPVAITGHAHPGQYGDDPASAAAYRAADRVIALLESDAAFYRSLGVTSERIAVCGNGSEGLRPAGQDVRAAAGVSGPLVLHVGVRRPYKGHDLLAEAAELVAAAHPEVSFAFVGPGPAMASLGIAKVHDAGAVDDGELGDWMAAADLVCLPSAGEAFGMAVLEAWSMGTAVLGSDLPTLRELIESGEGGEVAARNPGAIAAAILRLLGDRSRLAAMGAAGKAYWRARYTPGAVAACHERVYMQMAEASGIGAAR